MCGRLGPPHHPCVSNASWSSGSMAASSSPNASTCHAGLCSVMSCCSCLQYIERHGTRAGSVSQRSSMFFCVCMCLFFCFFFLPLMRVRFLQPKDPVDYWPNAPGRDLSVRSMPVTRAGAGVRIRRLSQSASSDIHSYTRGGVKISPVMMMTCLRIRHSGGDAGDRGHSKSAIRGPRKKAEEEE